MKTNLLNLSYQELEAAILNLKESKFRAKQLFAWFYQKVVTNPDLMTNLSIDFKNKILKHYKISIPQISHVAHSKEDNSYKFLLKTEDEKLIEAILMLKKDRVTLCVSCMVGCPLKCKFCATGSEIGFIRKLDVSEILGQIIEIKNYAIKNQIAPQITNIVFMGMGEPMLNIENVSQALDILLAPDGFAMSKSRITISTAGITDGLSNFINKYNVKLAVSLHFPTDELRSKYMPVNQKYPLKTLIAELKKIHLSKRSHIMIEYLMLDGINDSLNHAKQLVSLLANLKVKINLIPFNPTKTFDALSSSEDQINAFAKFLHSKGIMVTVRRSHGTKISGGCGQFALKA